VILKQLDPSPSRATGLIVNYPLLFLLVILTNFLTLSIWNHFSFPLRVQNRILTIFCIFLSLVFLTTYYAKQNHCMVTLYPLSETIFLFLWEFEIVRIPFLWFNMFFFHSLLVSGSDDLNAILWDPLQCQKKCCIKTGHSGNIFSVKVSHLALWIWIQVMELGLCHSLC